MNAFFATVFPNLSTAEEAQCQIEKLNDAQVLKLASSVVIVKGEDGEITQYNGRTPGALGARLGGLVGGITGLLAGPLVGIMGAVGGALSGGWFDLLRVEEREIFLNEVARNISMNRAALLGEVINPTDEAKDIVETCLIELGGTIIGRNSES